MGGFVSSTGYPVVTKKQLADPDLGPKFLADIKNVDAEDIMDKSKGDALSKGIAMVLGLWITQCFSRMHQQLAITELEVATLAFVVVNIFVWLLWRDKPLDVQRQIVVGPARLPDPLPMRPNHAPWVDRLVDRFFCAVSGFNDDHYDLLSSTSVPAFWSLPMDELDRIQDDYLQFAIEALVATVFGAIHCAAWNTDFLTAVEMWLWRSCSSLIVVIPAVILLIIVLGPFTDVDESQLGTAMLGIGVVLLIPIYVIARLILIILPLVALRSLPSGTFADVNWSVYIPHL
jgi:hypothetical protein